MERDAAGTVAGEETPPADVVRDLRALASQLSEKIPGLIRTAAHAEASACPRLGGALTDLAAVLAVGDRPLRRPGHDSIPPTTTDDAGEAA